MLVSDQPATFGGCFHPLVPSMLGLMTLRRFASGFIAALATIRLAACHGDPSVASDAQLAELKAASGPAFDTLFLRLMITHHEGALTMSREAQATGSDQRVQELADEVIAVQSAEINRMRDIRP